MPDPQNANSERKSLLKIIACSSGTKTDRRNQYTFVAWCLGWAVTFVACDWVLESNSGFSAPLNWFIALVPSALGIGAVLAYLKFLHMADELLQKIQLEGLAIGFGVGLIFGLGYEMLEKAGAPRLEINDLVLVLMGGWMLGQIRAARRYA